MTIITKQISTIDPTRVRDVMSKVPTSVTVVAGQPELTGERTAMTVDDSSPLLGTKQDTPIGADPLQDPSPGTWPRFLVASTIRTGRLS
jgi:hypothetical protein